MEALLPVVQFVGDVITRDDFRNYNIHHNPTIDLPVRDDIIGSHYRLISFDHVEMLL